MSHGFDTHDDLDYEDKARAAIPAANILRFVHYGELEFESLTHCDEWEPPLA